MEHELAIISGKVARDHVHVFVSYRPNQGVSQIVQWLKGISSRVPALARTDSKRDPFSTAALKRFFVVNAMPRGTCQGGRGLRWGKSTLLPAGRRLKCECA
jgi:REP element-mobilizing transposase RayT